MLALGAFGCASAPAQAPRPAPIAHASPSSAPSPSTSSAPTPSASKIVLPIVDPVIVPEIHFASGATLDAAANAAIDELAQILQSFPHILLVELEGHADESGTTADQLHVSFARARAVRDALVARGVDTSRLRAIGYGAYCPVAAGHDAAAWAKNRRVRPVLLLTTSGRTSAATGCAPATAAGIVSPPP